MGGSRGQIRESFGLTAQRLASVMEMGQWFVHPGQGFVGWPSFFSLQISLREAVTRREYHA